MKLSFKILLILTSALFLAACSELPRDYNQVTCGYLQGKTLNTFDNNLPSLNNDPDRDYLKALLAKRINDNNCEKGFVQK